MARPLTFGICTDQNMTWERSVDRWRMFEQLGLDSALEQIGRLQALDSLEDAMGDVDGPGDLARLDRGRVQDLLGDDAVRERLAEKGDRPLFTSAEQAARLFAERAPFYKIAHLITVPVDANFELAGRHELRQ